MLGKPPQILAIPFSGLRVDAQSSTLWCRCSERFACALFGNLAPGGLSVHTYLEKGVSMKFARMFLLPLCLLSFSVGAAQDSGTRIGFGVSLNPVTIFNLSTTSFSLITYGMTSIYVPIDAGKNFRVEPEVGILTSSTDYTYPATSYSPAYTTSSSSSGIRIGCGLLYIAPVDSTFNIYLGPRIGLLLSSDKYKSSTSSMEQTESETDFVLAGALGGEYLLSSHFGLGAEIQLTYISYGEPSITPAPSGMASVSRSTFSSSALAFFRWYF